MGDMYTTAAAEVQGPGCRVSVPNDVLHSAVQRIQAFVQRDNLRCFRAMTVL